MLGAKSSVIVAFLTISARLAVAAPPACLLAAVNTEEHPSDVSLLCGAHASDVQAQIRKLCGNDVEAALDAYRDTCKSAGKTISTESSSSSTSTDSSSASSTGASSASTPEKSSASAKKSSSASGTESGSKSSPSASVTGSGSASSATLAPYPITYTSTYYDTVCSCTKTTAISSSVVIGSSGFASATGSAGLAVPTGSLGSGSGASATGSPILPSGTNTPGSPGSTAAPHSFPGAASKNLGSFGAVILAVAGLVLAL